MFTVVMEALRVPAGSRHGRRRSKGGSLGKMTAPATRRGPQLPPLSENLRSKGKGRTRVGSQSAVTSVPPSSEVLEHSVVNKAALRGAFASCFQRHAPIFPVF